MTLLLETRTKTRRRSKKQQQALILNIPAQVRDIMKFEHGTEISMEVCLDENEEMYIKVQKID